MPAKKRSAKRASRTSAKSMRSFRLEKDEHKFTSLKFTKQTAYWLILIVFVVVTQLWILKLQLEIAELTNTLTNIVN
jgi:hypothetical protein